MKFLGIIVVFLLLGSAMYSSLFHLRIYFTQKTRIESGETGELYAHLHKNFNWTVVFFIQTIKIVVSILILIALFRPTMIMDEKNNVGWTTEGKKAFLQACIGNNPIRQLNNEQTKLFCKCVVNKTEQAFPNPDILDNDLPLEFVRNAQLSCFGEQFPNARWK